MPFKLFKLYFFPVRKITKKYVCLPYLKFSDLLPETHLFFYLALYKSFFTLHIINLYDTVIYNPYIWRVILFGAIGSIHKKMSKQKKYKTVKYSFKFSYTISNK